MTGSMRINLALQGGGSHGAFTWGLLDALPEDGRLELEAVSDTSAGAYKCSSHGPGLRPRRHRRRPAGVAGYLLLD